MQIQMIQIKDLILDAKNPRKISKDQFEKLCESLRKDPEFFHQRPCLVNEVDGVYHVYAGNQRARAAKKLGWKEVPCSIGKDLGEEIIRERTIKDNKQYGEWDYDILANEYDLEFLVDCGFEEKDLGFTDDEVSIIDEEKEDNEKIKKCPHCDGIL